MRFVPTSDGLMLALHEHGGTGQPTLFAHATGLHAAVWEPFSSALGDGFERWALDFRGHGASVVPANQGLAWSEMGADVETIVEHLSLEPGRLLGIGHSMGGAALLLAEQARPGTFAGLWLFEPITPPPGAMASPAGGQRMAEGAARRRARFPSRAEALANYASKPPLNTCRADALHAYVRHGFVGGEDGAVHLACRPEDEARIFLNGGDSSAFGRLGEVQCPVVVVCGADPAGPAAFSPAIVAALPTGRLERHPHIGHFGPMEAPGLLASSVAAFAAELA